MSSGAIGTERFAQDPLSALTNEIFLAIVEHLCPEDFLQLKKVLVAKVEQVQGIYLRRYSQALGLVYSSSEDMVPKIKNRLSQLFGSKVGNTPSLIEIEKEFKKFREKTFFAFVKEIASRSPSLTLPTMKNARKWLEDPSNQPGFQRVHFLDLSNRGMIQLPDELDHIRKIRRLYIDGNPLASLFSAGVLDRLEILRIESEQLRIIAESIGCLPNLHVLHISGEKSAIPPEICAALDLRVQYLKKRGCLSPSRFS